MSESKKGYQKSNEKKRSGIPASIAFIADNLSTNCSKSCSGATSGLRSAAVFFENQLLGYKEVAQYLSISETYLRRLKSQGKIPYVMVGRRGIRFKVASLNAWIAEREIKK